MAAQTPERAKTNWPEVASFVPTTHHDTYPAIAAARADLAGKTAVITGASKGVGRATALSFAAAGCSRLVLGARSALDEVVAAVRRAAAEAGRPEPEVLGLKLDVTDEASVRAAAGEVDKALGDGAGLDVLINNAGYLETWLPLTESNPSDWWYSWDVNMRGTYLCLRYFLPLMRRGDSGGTVINITSAGGHNVATGASAYQTARFAACRLTEFVHHENAASGIVAVAMHPGGVKTDLALNMPEWMHSILIDEPELAADTMLWLAREKREWLSGRFLSTNWDVEELERRKDEIIEKDLLKFRMVI